MKFNAIIFDLGNVLVDWNPAYLFDKLFTDKKAEAFFLGQVCNMDWHSRQDAGRSVEEATEARVAAFPEWEAPIRAYYGRWSEMFRGPIEGSVQLLRLLREKGYRTYALTNWNADLYRQSAENYPFLKWFDGKVISGEVGLIKPDPRIFEYLLNKYQLSAGQTLFIDDNTRNVEAAKALGLHGILFQSPEQLRQELMHLGLL